MSSTGADRGRARRTRGSSSRQVRLPALQTLCVSKNVDSASECAVSRVFPSAQVNCTSIVDIHLHLPCGDSPRGNECGWCFDLAAREELCRDCRRCFGCGNDFSRTPSKMCTATREVEPMTRPPTPTLLATFCKETLAAFLENPNVICEAMRGGRGDPPS